MIAQEPVADKVEVAERVAELQQFIEAAALDGVAAHEVEEGLFRRVLGLGRTMLGEFFARQGGITFTDDPIALHNLPFTGADCLMWGSDYPHDEGSFPHSQEVIARTFAGLSAHERQKIVRDNAARLYGFDA